MVVFFIELNSPALHRGRDYRENALQCNNEAHPPLSQGEARGGSIINQKSNSFSQPGVNRIGGDFPVGGHGQAVDVDVLRLDERGDGDGGYATLAPVA